MNTWIFQGNPDKFRVDEYLLKTRDVYWSVRIPKHQSEIRVGDEVYIWRAKGSQNAVSGIIAFGVVNEECKPREAVLNKLNLYDDLWVEASSEASNIKAGVTIKELRLSPMDGMLTSEELAKDPTLSKMQILRTRVGTNFLLAESQSRIVRNYWAGLDLDNKEEDDEYYPSKEGRIQLRLHKVRERDPKLRKKTIELFVKENKKVFCEICKFSFEDKYGELGKDFIEVHHLKPISEYKDDDATKIEDLKLVCANCHRMIHRGDPYLTFFALREKLFPYYA